MRRETRHLFILTFIFLLSRAIYLLCFGIKFNSSPLTYYWQYLDPELLKNDLFRSIFYLHQQPPLFNLLLGLVLKWSSENAAIVYQTIFIAFGLMLSLSLYCAMIELKVKPRISLVLAIAYTISPTTLFYENWLFYPYPVALMLCASVVFLARFLKSQKPLDGLCFFGLLSALTLTRSLFHPFLIYFFASLIIFLLKKSRAILAISIALPCIFVTIFILKQYIVFETVSAGASYLGQNLATRTNNHVPESIKMDLLLKKKVSNLFFKYTNHPISKYQIYLPPIELKQVLALDQEIKSTGAINFNHIGYLAQSRAYLKDFLEVIKTCPKCYLDSFAATTLYFSPANNDSLVRGGNYQGYIASITSTYNLIFLGQIDGNTSWVLVFILPILFLYGLLLVFKNFLKDRKDIFSWFIPFYLTFFIAWLTVITVSISSGDYNRYRFEFDPLFISLLGMLLTNINNSYGKYK